MPITAREMQMKAGTYRVNRFACVMNGFEGDDIKLGVGPDAFLAMRNALGEDDLNQLLIDRGYEQGEYCDEGVSIVRLDGKPIGVVVNTGRLFVRSLGAAAAVQVSKKRAEIGDVRVAETPYGGRWMIEIYDRCEYTLTDKWVSHRGSYESQCAAKRALESFLTFGATDRS